MLITRKENYAWTSAWGAVRTAEEGMRWNSGNPASLLWSLWPLRASAACQAESCFLLSPLVFFEWGTRLPLLDTAHVQLAGLVLCMFCLSPDFAVVCRNKAWACCTTRAHHLTLTPRQTVTCGVFESPISSEEQRWETLFGLQKSLLMRPIYLFSSKGGGRQWQLEQSWNVKWGRFQLLPVAQIQKINWKHCPPVLSGL